MKQFAIALLIAGTITHNCSAMFRARVAHASQAAARVPVRQNSTGGCGDPLLRVAPKPELYACVKKALDSMTNERKVELRNQGKEFEYIFFGDGGFTQRWSDFLSSNDLISKSLILDQVDVNGRTVLIKAAAIPALRKMVGLLTYGAHAGAVDYVGRTALTANIKKLTPKIVKLLLKEKLDPNLQDPHDGDTALHELAASDLDITARILWDITGEDPTIYEKQQCEIARILLEKGARMEQRNKFGSTPVMIAAFTKNQKMLDIFRAAGANIDRAYSELERQRKYEPIDGKYFKSE